MPRPNAARSLGSEEQLARRIRQLREERGWSHEQLARSMTREGCPINQTASWKIENGKPPRRITVDELVAFSRVFDVPIDDLLLPPELVLDRKTHELIERWITANRDMTEAYGRRVTVEQELNAHLTASPDALAVAKAELDRIIEAAIAKNPEGADVGFFRPLWDLRHEELGSVALAERQSTGRRAAKAKPSQRKTRGAK